MRPVRLALLFLLALPPVTRAASFPVFVDSQLLMDSAYHPSLGWIYSLTGNGQLVVSGATTGQGFISMSLDVLLKKNQAPTDETCQASGTVAQGALLCTVSEAGPCPGVGGIYRVQTDGRVGSRSQTVLSSSRDADCSLAPPPPPNPCSASYRSGATTVIDLATGLPVASGLADQLPPVELTRREDREGKSLVLEEWKVVRVGEAGPGLLDAERDHLVIYAPRHRMGMQPPAIKWRARSLRGFDLAQHADKPLVLRATFALSGALADVEVIQGEKALAQALAEGLELEHLRNGHDHHVVVFAAFDLSRGTAPVSAIPILPQCCCGGVFCV